MKRKAKSQATHSGLAVVNPNAAAIDIGATIHVAAVGADRVRSAPVHSRNRAARLLDERGFEVGRTSAPSRRCGDAHC